MKYKDRDFIDIIYKGDKENLKKLERYKRNIFRVFFNFLIISLCKYLPCYSFKITLYRLIGIKIGKNVIIGTDVIFDYSHPELIEIGDNSIIGACAKFFVHDSTRRKIRYGKIIIGKNVLIGGNAYVPEGVKIGDGATVSSCSFVNKNVKPFTFVEGVPIRVVKKTFKSK